MRLLVVRFVPRFSNQYLNFSSMRSVEWYVRTAKISPKCPLLIKGPAVGKDWIVLALTVAQ